MVRVEVKPRLLQWAVQRSGARGTALYERFPKLVEWERGESRPTLKQLEEFSQAARVPVGYLFLSEPPEETLPIPDLRTVGGRGVVQPSPDLLDVVYLCQRRQAWYQDYAERAGEEPREFVGSARLKDSPASVAQSMRKRLGFSVEERRLCGTWEDAFRLFVQRAEDVGVLVMVSGVVGSNNQRALDPDEFRGFALADRLAPLVFINRADTKAAQSFTLAHELAHIWAGRSAVSDAHPASLPTDGVESWCNAVAAELLVPLAELRRELKQGDPLKAVPDLARTFKVSTLVVLRRLWDARQISRESFQRVYASESKRLAERPRSGGGDFYRAQPARTSRRFARALIASTLEGHTLYRDAFQMLGISKQETFRELGRKLEVLP